MPKNFESIWICNSFSNLKNFECTEMKTTDFPTEEQKNERKKVRQRRLHGELSEYKQLNYRQWIHRFNAISARGEQKDMYIQFLYTKNEI